MRLHIVDAFTNRPFLGNPAAVCVLDEPADEGWMKLVAREMNLSETAFLHPVEGGWSLRWLTPVAEVKLCGHATLASAFTLWETGRLGHDQAAQFNTLSGWLTCRKIGSWIEMDFPALIVEPFPVPEGLLEALGCSSTCQTASSSNVVEVCNTGMDYLVEVANESLLRGLEPDFTALARLPIRGLIVSARSESPEFDFVSRFFAPGVGVNEDPVTGSAHCALGPYWRSKLGKSDLIAYQASTRGGVVQVGVRENRVLLRGEAVMMGTTELRH